MSEKYISKNTVTFLGVSASRDDGGLLEADLLPKNMGSGNLFAISFPGGLGRNSFLGMKNGMPGYWGNVEMG